MPLLHKQYKTARTETRWHLLLKIRQMPIQTSASRGYVLFISGNKRHTKVLKLSAGLRTHPAECSKLGKTQIIKDAGRGMVRNTGFCDQNDRLRLHPETSENFYIIRALFPAASAFGGMFIPLYLRSWYLREDSASCQYRGSRHL